jgi:hypothetical protein
MTADIKCDELPGKISAIVLDRLRGCASAKSAAAEARRL